MANNRSEHSFKIFANNLKAGDFPSVILMYGVEQYLVSWAMDSLVKKYVNPATIQMDYTVLSEDLTARDILTSCNTFSMFSEKRIVWARDFAPLSRDNAKGFGAEEIESLLEYARNPNPGAILVFSCESPSEKGTLFKGLKTTAGVYDFCPLDDSQFIGFAQKRFNAAGVTASNSVLRMMLDISGYKNKESNYHLFNLVNDINKVISHCNNGVVTEEDISLAINGDLDKFMFNFIDAVSTNNKERAFTIMHNMLVDGIQTFAIIGMIASQVELMLQVKEMRELGITAIDISKKIKVHEFRVKKALSYGDRFSYEKLRKMLTSIYDVDKDIKMGNIEASIALELFVARI